MIENKNIGGLYKPLSDEQVETIHNAALTILEDVGITYTPDQIDLIEELRIAGARIERDKSRIRFDRKLIKQALSHAPDRLVLHSRNGKNDLDLYGDRVYFGTGGTTTTILDMATGQCRPSSLDDLCRIARLVERLRNIDLFIRPCTPMELPEGAYDVNICYAALKGTRKHVMLGIFDHKRVADVIDIAAMVAGGMEKLREKPILSFYTSFGLSPLQQSHKPTRILYEAVTHRIPISVSSVPMAGMTGPITMAGTLTLTHAEVMSGLVMAQLIQPGAPVMYGGLPSIADMQTANFAGGAMEAGIIRQGIRKMHLYAHSNGTAVDELVGAGCVSKLEIAYGGNGKAAPTCIRFRKAVQDNLILFEDYSNYMMGLRFLAGAMGVPFLPTLSGLGSEIVTRWGFSKAMRQADPRIVNEKLIVMDNPFEGLMGAAKVLLLPAITPDVSIIHVQRADTMGTCSIQGLTFTDVEQVKASRNVIVTCEDLVKAEILRQDPDRNQIPFIHISAVCHVPHGGYPTAVYNYYDYDARYLRDFAIAAKDENQFKAYQGKYIYGVDSHQGLLALVGEKRLETIKADPNTGYAVNMKRD